MRVPRAELPLLYIDTLHSHSSARACRPLPSDQVSWRSPRDFALQPNSAAAFLIQASGRHGPSGTNGGYGIGSS